MLREKIAKLIYHNLPTGSAYEKKEDIADQTHKVYKDWFRQEVEKLKPLSDEEIIKILWPLFSSVCNRIPSEITLTADDIGIANRRIAQAQLQDCKDTLLRMME